MSTDRMQGPDQGGMSLETAQAIIRENWCLTWGRQPDNPDRLIDFAAGVMAANETPNKSDADLEELEIAAETVYYFSE